MQFVRCGACGAKALPAASRCPRCAHVLNLRNDAGALVPLVRCPSCDTYFPRVQGACRWCTPQPAGSSLNMVARVGLAVVLVCALGVGAWWFLVRGRAPAEKAASQKSATTATSVPSGLPVPVADTLLPPAVDSATTDTIPPTRDAALALRAPSVSPPIPASIAWTPATANTWVNVHVTPERASRTIGVVERYAQVQLGDAQFGWRRIRSGPVTGWVDPGLFTLELIRRER